MYGCVRQLTARIRDMEHAAKEAAFTASLAVAAEQRLTQEAKDAAKQANQAFEHLRDQLTVYRERLEAFQVRGCLSERRLAPSDDALSVPAFHRS